MALASTAFFASFGITDGAQERDISPFLADAIYFDLNLLGALNVDFGSPAEDVIHYWNDDVLNPDTGTVTGSVAAGGTSIVLAAGQGARFRVGDLLYDTTLNSTEVIQVTAIATDTLTVTRGYNSTATAALADQAIVARMSAEQEGSDIGPDRSLSPLVFTNYTQIVRGNDVLITGSQLARKMATDKMADYLARQVANRAIELKIQLSRLFLYGEKSASVGSQTTYRTCAGLRAWARDNGGTVDTASTPLAYSILNSINKTIVDKGVFPDTVVVGTDLMNTIANYDSSNRRLYESDKVAGYTVNEVLLAQGNSVKVIVDSRVKAGDGFLFPSENIKAIPLQGRGMVMIAATDFADARKRRILGEWTTEIHHPEATAYWRNKT